VTNREGKEVMRFKVRLEGAAGRDRMKKNSDTPLGLYDIPETGTWISGGSRQSYGPNHRLALDGESGEIKKSGRSEIRIHGGRQETYNSETNIWTSVANPKLKKTYGCMRCYDDDIQNMKSITDDLETNDPLEKAGKLEIKADLIEYDGKYYTPDDYEHLNKEKQILNQVQSLNSNIGGNSREVRKQEQNVKSIEERGIK